MLGREGHKWRLYPGGRLLQWHAEELKTPQYEVLGVKAVECPNNIIQYS